MKKDHNIIHDLDYEWIACDKLDLGCSQFSQALSRKFRLHVLQTIKEGSDQRMMSKRSKPKRSTALLRMKVSQSYCKLTSKTFEMNFLLSLVALLLLNVSVASGAIVSNSTRLPEGHISFHYDDAVESQCDTVAIVGVGTAMGATAYQSLSTDIVTGSSLVFIMMDFNPGGMVKLSARKYTKLANAVAEQITSLVPACKTSPKHGFIVGGHSAGGQAAMQALPSLIPTVNPIGFLGLDPFNAKKGGTITIPAMYWGFAKTTCFVTAKNAAAFAYNHTTNKDRVFFQVANTRQKITHCIFTDNGCGGLACPSKKDYSWVRTAVGDTVRRFVAAVVHGEFIAREFLLPEYNDVNINVDGTSIQHVPEVFKGNNRLIPAFA